MVCMSLWGAYCCCRSPACAGTLAKRARPATAIAAPAMFLRQHTSLSYAMHNLRRATCGTGMRDHAKLGASDGGYRWPHVMLDGNLCLYNGELPQLMAPLRLSTLLHSKQLLDLVPLGIAESMHRIYRASGKARSSNSNNNVLHQMSDLLHC